MRGAVIPFLPELVIIVLTVLTLAFRKLPVLRTATLASVFGYAYFLLLLGVLSGGRGIGSPDVDASSAHKQGWVAATRVAEDYIERRSVALLVALSCLLLLCVLTCRQNRMTS